MSQPNPKVLIVEGKNDQHAVAELIKANGVIWGEKKEDWVVEIKEYGGFENIISEKAISAAFKGNTKILGIIVDADEDILPRWESLKKQCSTIFPSFPANPQAGGLAIGNTTGQKLGIWVMPDNVSSGKLENFLCKLVPGDQSALFNYAKTATTEAQILHAPFASKDRVKAEIHTWLAWQETPGLPFGTAVKALVLRPDSLYAQTFVRWFKQLYELT